MMCGERIERKRGAGLAEGVALRKADEAGERAVAARIGGEEREMMAAVHRHLCAENRLDRRARARRRDKRHRADEVVVVGERERGQSQLRRARAERIGR